MMTRRVALALSLSIAVAACSDSDGVTGSVSGSSADRAAAAAAGTIPGQYIVVLRSNVSDVGATARGLAGAHGASVRHVYGTAIKGFSAHMNATAAAAMARNPNVDFVEQDQVVQADDIINQPVGAEIWGLDRIDARTGLDGSYGYSLTGAGVSAYIIDTGIFPGHTEFGGRVSGGAGYVADGGGTNDCDGHGTHVAGTVGGATYGVAKNVTLVPVRVLNCSGSGSWSDVIAGINWVAANAVHPAVANMSLGGGASSAVDLAVQNAIASGVAFAIAAGNGNTAGVAQNACNYSPARVPEAMTIGATDNTDLKASWSNYGSCVDFFAPGVGIKSAWYSSPTATNTISGTSMATPHTAGVAALYLESNPTASAQNVRDALFMEASKMVVRSSGTTNNHLLHAPSDGVFGVAPPSSAPPSLVVTTSKSKSNWTANLSWSGFDGVTAFTVLRNGGAIATGVAGSTFTDSGKGGGSVTYKVCATSAPTVCTQSVTVSP